MHTHTKTTKFCLVSASCWVAGSGCEGTNSPSPDPNTLEEKPVACGYVPEIAPKNDCVGNTDVFDIDGTVVDDPVTAAGKYFDVGLEYTNSGFCEGASTVDGCDAVVSVGGCEDTPPVDGCEDAPFANGCEDAPSVEFCRPKVHHITAVSIFCC